MWSIMLHFRFQNPNFLFLQLHTAALHMSVGRQCAGQQPGEKVIRMKMKLVCAADKDARVRKNHGDGGGMWKQAEV